MKRSFSRLFPYASLTALVLAGAQTAYAAPVLPDAAMSEAADFLSRSHNGINAIPGNVQLSLAYTADAEGTAAYYIFNHQNGFVIVSADDRLPSVLGYSDNGCFDPDRTPENMKWWLGEYQREIKAWLPNAPETPEAVNIKRAVANRPAIAPLLKTKWNQDAPYNNNCPLDHSQRAVTGCVATAMAQLMKYHEWPERPVGSNAGIVFDGNPFNWKNMLDVYETGKYTATQAAAVARLMRFCGAAVNMQYSYWSSGAYDYEVPWAFTRYFNYDPSVEMVWKDYTAQSRWNDLVYAELQEGRPLYYSGSSNQGGHAFVCDGYSENEYFHFNWGWGGYQDGYYRLTALNPASGGAGSYEGGYNSGQTILINLKPAQNPGSNAPEQKGLLSTGAFSYSGNNTFEITHDPANFNLIYNPFFYRQTLTIGMRYASLDRPGEAPKYITVGESTLEPLYGFKDLTAGAPILSNGTYSVTPVYSDDRGTTWNPILIPLGKQNYVRLTVDGNNISYENAGPDESNSPVLIAEFPISTPVIYGNADKAFCLPIINLGQGDYMGNLGFTLVQEDAEFGDSASVTESAPVAGKSYNEWEVTFDDDLSPGYYRLYVQDDDENFLIDGVRIEIKDGNFPSITSSKSVTVEDLAPNFMTSGKDNPIYFTVNSTSIFEETIKFRFTILNAETLEKIQDLPDYSVTVPANYTGRVSISPRDLGVKPGKYMWYVADDKGNAISRATPLIVTSAGETADGIRYIITDETAKTATVVPLEGTPYSGDCVVPASIDGYNLTAIRNDAFAFSTAASVTLPASIGRIPAGAFYDDWRLETLTLEAENMVETGKMAFNTRYIPACWLVVNDQLSNAYHYDPRWSAFKMSAWHLQLDGVKVKSGLMENPATGEFYAPYFVNCFSEMDIWFDDPDGKNIRIEMNISGKRLTDQVIDPRTTALHLPAIGMHGQGYISAYVTDDKVGVEGITESDSPEDVYSIDGTIVLRQATPDQIRSLEPGLYIIGGVKRIIR